MKKFKLQGSLPSTNYVLFNEKGKICKYMSEVDIIKNFFSLRANLYELRKKFMLAKLQKDYETLFNKVKFI